MIDEFSYELGKRAASGGGEAVLIDKTISANGTYNASSDNADGFKKAVVNVPNSYSAGDEGKVVSNGALVAQGSDTVTQNGTVDTTLINSLLVNVSGGGGGSSWTLVGSAEFEVNTSSTSEMEVGYVDLDVDSIAEGDIFWIHIRDKAGKRTNYFYGNDSIRIFWENGDTGSGAQIRAAFYGTSNGYSGGNSSNGVSCSTVYASTKKAKIVSKYSVTYGTIDGTYKVDVYKLTPASGMVMFE